MLWLHRATIILYKCQSGFFLTPGWQGGITNEVVVKIREKAYQAAVCMLELIFCDQSDLAKRAELAGRSALRSL